MPGFECLTIKLVETTDEQIVLQGTELGMGWTMALDRASGDMAITLVSREGAFVFFGSCAVQ
jgi:hypothetical protein